MLQKSRALFERNIYGNIIYNAREMQDYIEFLNEDDPAVLKALELLREGKSVPQLEETDDAETTKKVACATLKAAAHIFRA